MPPEPEEIVFTHMREDGEMLFGRYRPGSGPLICFLPGFRSIHIGEKAMAVAGFAREQGHACLRFDYLAHGASDGDFHNFRVSEAMRDTARCIDQVRAPGQALYVVGSSMGGWIGLELIRKKELAADGLLLIAPAVDFISRRLATLPPDTLEELQQNGFINVPDAYDGNRHYRLDNAFFEDAMISEPPREGNLDVPCPVRIVHGSEDEAVPLVVSQQLKARIPGSRLMEIEGGDHRLSAHIPTILEELDQLILRRQSVVTKGL